MSRNGRVFALAVAGLAIVGGLAWWAVDQRRVAAGPSPSSDAPVLRALSFVGSDKCASCHAREHARWLGSQHQRAMQHAAADTVRGDFEDSRFVYAGVTSSFLRRDDRFYIRTDGPDGRLADFELKYTFGVEPLQQYLVELSGGRLQAVSIAWDTRPKEEGGQRWFHLHPGENIDHRDELHWTRGSQNWNFMCADCHSTGLQKGYDPVTGNYHTTYAEMSVGCEACHGPGSAHLSWASSQQSGRGGEVRNKGLTILLDERRGVSWSANAASGHPRRSTPRTTEREIEVCAQCHSRRAQIAEGYEPGRAFLDHYLPALISPGLYHVDGQQQDEVYVWGSWLQSRMHSAGVTCSDCHDPHTQQLRAPGNAVCAQCHTASRYDTASHHHHATGSAGSQCANCHMPSREYMVVDPRRDHSLRVPRPDQSVALGVPNACNACHVERDATWAAAAVRAWLGRDAAGFQTFAEDFAAADMGQAGADARLSKLAFDTAQPPIVRASALARLGTVGSVDPELARRAATDPVPLVRLAAVELAEALPPAARTRAFAPLLADPRLAIRIEAARVLAGDARVAASGGATCAQIGRGGVPRDAAVQRRPSGGQCRARRLPCDARTSGGSAACLRDGQAPRFAIRSRVCQRG